MVSFRARVLGLVRGLGFILKGLLKGLWFWVLKIRVLKGSRRSCIWFWCNSFWQVAEFARMDGRMDGWMDGRTDGWMCVIT